MMEPNLIPLTAQFSGGISNVVPRCYGCTTFTTTYDDFEWPDEDFPPTGGGGSGGGGGSSEPPETDCTGVPDCGLSSRIVEGRVPCGDCGPGPIVIVPDDETISADVGVQIIKKPAPLAAHAEAGVFTGFNKFGGATTYSPI